MDDTLSLEIEVLDDKATVKVDRFTRSLGKLDADINNLAKNTKLGENLSSQLSIVDVKANKLTTSLKDISKVSAGRGFDSMSLSASQATNEISKIQKQLSGIRDLADKAPNANIFRQLGREAKNLESDLDKIGNKVNRYQQNNLGGGESGSGKIGRIRGFGALFRAADLGINETELNAGIAGLELLDKRLTAVRASTAALGAESAAASSSIGGISVATLATIAPFAAVAAIGVGIVKVTQNWKEEAQKALKVEEAITAEFVKQHKAQTDATKELTYQIDLAQRGRDLSANLQQAQFGDIDTLERQKKNKIDISNIAPTSDGAKVLNQEILQIAARIDELKRKRVTDLDDTFNKNYENYVKSAEKDKEFEEKRREEAKKALEKRNEDIKRATEKVGELGKVYIKTFDDLFSKSDKNNPFVSVFSEADKALTDLRKNLAGLSPELQAQAVALQTKINSNNLFSSKLDNALSTFNLRDEAANFRNFKPAFDVSQADEIARRNISYGNFFPNFGGTFGSDLANKAGGFDKLTDKQKRDIYQTSLLSQPSFNTDSPSTFNALNQKSLVSKLAAEQLALANPDENKSFQEKLQKELDIVNKFKLGAATQDQVDAANRNIVSLTSVDPSKLDDRERSQAAVAREALADRQDKYQQEALAIEKEKLKVQQSIDKNQKNLLAIAEKEGIKGIEKLLVEVKDSPTTKTTVTRANPADAAKKMDLSGTYFEQSQKK